MRKLLRAGCLFALATLAGCTGDSSSTPTTSKQSAATKTQSAARPLTVTTSQSGLVQQTTTNGVKVQLQDRFQHAVVARRNADGSLATGCHDEHTEAESFMQGATATQPEVQ
jgi:hypothetical protein